MLTKINNNIKGYYKMLISKIIIRILPIFALIAAIFMIVKLSPLGGDHWSTEGTDDTREAKRGTFVSICSAVFMSIIGGIMVWIGVPDSMIVTNYGFFLGPVISYMLDIGFGTDDGLRKTKKGFLTGAGHVFSKLISAEFIRYIVTVFLDMFISNPILDVMNLQANKMGLIKALKDATHSFGFYDRAIASNFPSILQSIVGFVTFESYTNQTRFAWAYPNKRLPKEKRIGVPTIMLATAVAGVGFIGFYKLLNMILKDQDYSINLKLMFVLTSFILLYILSTQNLAEAKYENKKDEDEAADDSMFGKIKPILGIILFLLLLTYGLIYPVMYAMLGGAKA